MLLMFSPSAERLPSLSVGDVIKCCVDVRVIVPTAYYTCPDEEPLVTLQIQIHHGKIQAVLRIESSSFEIIHSDTSPLDTKEPSSRSSLDFKIGLCLSSWFHFTRANPAGPAVPTPGVWTADYEHSRPVKLHDIKAVECYVDICVQVRRSLRVLIPRKHRNAIPQKISAMSNVSRNDKYIQILVTDFTSSQKLLNMVCAPYCP